MRTSGMRARPAFWTGSALRRDLVSRSLFGDRKVNELGCAEQDFARRLQSCTQIKGAAWLRLPPDQVPHSRGCLQMFI